MGQCHRWPGAEIKLTYQSDPFFLRPPNVPSGGLDIISSSVWVCEGASERVFECVSGRVVSDVREWPCCVSGRASCCTSMSVRVWKSVQARTCSETTNPDRTWCPWASSQDLRCGRAVCGHACTDWRRSGRTRRRFRWGFLCRSIGTSTHTTRRLQSIGPQALPAKSGLTPH